MKAFILVADYAKLHPDNTLTVVRGGITQLTKRTDDFVHKIYVAVRIETYGTEAGKHQLHMGLRDQDGAAVGPQAKAKIVFPQSNGSTWLEPLEVSGCFPLGVYEFGLAIDGRQIATWPITVVLAEPPQNESSIESA